MKPKELSKIQKKVLQVFIDHINKPCPTNRQIAELSGLERTTSEKATISLCRYGILTRIIDSSERYFIINHNGDPSRDEKAEKQQTARGPFREMTEDCGTWRPHFTPSPGMKYPDGTPAGMLYKDTPIKKKMMRLDIEDA